MAVMNPCCCKLQLGTTIVAILNMVLSLVGLLWYLVGMLIGVGTALVAVLDKDSKQQFGGTTRANRGHQNVSDDTFLSIIGIFLFVLTIIIVASCTLTFVASAILFVGAKKRNISKCRLWFVVMLIFLIIYILYKGVQIGVTIWASTQSEQAAAVGIIIVIKEIIGLVLTVLIEVYQLWVVYAFMDELKREGRAETAYEPSTVTYTTKADDNPPPYPHGGPTAYTPYAAAPTQAGFVGYPVLPPPNDALPYKEAHN